MDIDVLGALAVRENGVSITPTAPKPRQVLSLLALNADRVVPVTDLTEELWGGHPPRSARTTLQTYVLQLRECINRALDGGDAKDVLMTLPGGYLLVSGGDTDVRRFERLVGEGYRAMDAEAFAEASARLGQALKLWTGTALADVQHGPLLRTEVTRLEESRLCALDQRIEADLHLGRHRELLSELTVLTSRHPAHENLHAQFMLALARSGRRGEALQAYGQLRTTLLRDRGLEPSPRLQRLQHSIQAAAAEPAGDTLLAAG
ncbi:AfsR/SARP family transcriptional regulator [Streptomyces sp. ITFR-16]|uniref:AfsR/SARP family transcriptional regulator n=1 Tax=Streptomyces sp. ITFR-16 TaxID=3075198 RepID=UPI0028890243|nr:AfsR/SARP family transcriptional regulator [Streptomyces sp. ITFR-16]WNI27243.1 AfsR/SARP family transcriptional regulator [Streptomyces sp. ITFR-16]